jgi:hypothetical protein
MTSTEDNAKKGVLLQLKNAANHGQTDTVCFTNWTIVGVTDSKKKGKDGKEVPSKVPVYVGKPQKELLEEALDLLPGWINFNGVLTEVLIDPVTNHLSVLARNNDLEVESAYNDKNVIINFKNNVEMAVKWKPFTISLKNYVRKVTQVTKYPTWPKRSDKVELIPGIEAQPTGALDLFLEYFCPETEKDRLLLKALFVTPAWSEGQGHRPLFIIAGPSDADSNVSIGKTTLVDMLIRLYESGSSIHPEVSTDRLTTNLMNLAEKQIIMIDNVRTERWSSTALERLITSPEISGHKMYVGQSSFPNNFTFVVTINDPQMTEDLASRSVVIRIKPPKVLGGWRENIQTFIETMRLDVLRDIGSIIMAERVADADENSNFRFPIWKTHILNKIGPNLSEHIKEQIELLKVNDDFKDWGDFVYDMVNKYYFVTDNSTATITIHSFRIFVSTSIMFEWFQTFQNKRPGGSPRGAEGKKLKKICESAGFSYAPDVYVKNQCRSGYWINPQLVSGPRAGIVAQVREHPNAWPINSR